jgi:hypothetical protein
MKAEVSCISASDMHSEKSDMKKHKSKICIMLLILKDLKRYLRSSILSFRLGQNLSSKQPPLSPFTQGESEGFPPSGNDKYWNRVRYVLFVIFVCMALCSSLSAGIKDRVVAYVDSTAITLSELEKKYAETVHVTPAVTREEVLDTMINRLLFVREARKIRLKSQLEDELLKEYVDLQIRAFIRIKDEEIRTFFDTHASDFLGKELDEMREDIENYLIEQEVNKRLKEHIAELRNNACVKIQLNRQNQE